MSMNIFAARFEEDEEYGQVLRGVLDAKHWEMDMVAEDADDRIERGESAFIDNPDYIPGAGLNMANDNVATMLNQLGFKIGPDGYVDIAIDDLHPAVMRGLNGRAARHTESPVAYRADGGCQVVDCGIPPGYMIKRLTDLLTVMDTGRKHGATHVTFA